MCLGSLFCPIAIVACGGKIEEGTESSAYSPINVCSSSVPACSLVSGADVSSVMAQDFDGGVSLRLPSNPEGSSSCNFGDASSHPQVAVAFPCPQPDSATVNAQFQQRIAAGLSVDASVGAGWGSLAVWDPPTNGYGVLRVLSQQYTDAHYFVITIAAPSLEPDPLLSAQVLANDVIENL
jgi:hypothetical protein